jgi:NAD(P)-dependent dehydrogenase (short-subunit alcohol dehydrogenase family)
VLKYPINKSNAEEGTMRRILITGSNRGIGLALVQQYLLQENTLIFATCRQPATADALNALAHEQPERVKVLRLDVADTESIAASSRAVAAQVDGLDMLINNAGILPGGVDNREPNSASFGALEAGAMLHVFHVNSISPVLVTQAYADLLRKGNQARVINVSSDAGSIAQQQHGCSYSYPASKAALNMLTRCLAGDLRDDNITVISIHPGWIQTDMGGVRARLTLEQAIPTMVKVMDDLTVADTGSFLNWDGDHVAW